MMYAVIAFSSLTRRTGHARLGLSSNGAAPGSPRGRVPLLPVTSLLFLRPSGTLDRSCADRSDVDELPFRMQDRMLLVADDPRLHQLGGIAAEFGPPPRVGLQESSPLL